MRCARFAFGWGVFFFNDTATTEIYTLSLHDALPIFGDRDEDSAPCGPVELRHHEPVHAGGGAEDLDLRERRSEEHTSELQSRQYLVCRLLLEKKNQSCNYSSRTLINPDSTILRIPSS